LTAFRGSAYPEWVMLFNISGLIQEGIGATRTFAIDDQLVSEDRPPEPVTGTVEVLRTRDGVLVRAHLTLVSAETCSRCLKPLQETLHIDFEEEFKATVDARTGRPLEQEEADQEAFRIDENHMLDLTEAIRQYREAAAVIQPLCRPDCLGLCPRCGQDLNAGTCDCHTAAVDSRWAALAGLLPRDSEGKD
jgi:uncharacterized protein